MYIRPKIKYQCGWTKIISEAVCIIPCTLVLCDLYNMGNIFHLQPRFTLWTWINLILSVVMYFITTRTRFINYINHKTSK